MAKSASPVRVRQAPAGGSLLDFDGSDVSFGLVVGEGHGQVDHEAQDHVFVVSETPGGGHRVSGQLPGAGAVGVDAQCGSAAVVVADGGQQLGVQGGLPGGAGGRCGGVRVGQGGGHRGRPELSLRVGGVDRTKITE
jgi:hypothetical protein